MTIEVRLPRMNDNNCKQIDEIIVWCVWNLEVPDWQWQPQTTILGPIFFFKNPKDATMFRLKWSNIK